jgi:hypothetical protein
LRLFLRCWAKQHGCKDADPETAWSKATNGFRANQLIAKPDRSYIWHEPMVKAFTTKAAYLRRRRSLQQSRGIITVLRKFGAFRQRRRQKFKHRALLAAPFAAWTALKLVGRCSSSLPAQW